MKLTDQPKDLVKAVQEVMKTTTPPADKQKLSDSLASRYENMRPKQINEKTESPSDQIKRLNKQVDDMNKQLDKTEKNLKGVSDAERVSRLKSAHERRMQLYRDIKKTKPGSPENEDLKTKINKADAEVEANYPQKPQGFGLPVELPKQPRRPEKKQVATVTPTDMQGRPVNKPEPSPGRDRPLPSWMTKERNKQVAEPAKAPKSVDVGDKIELPKIDTTKPKLAEPPKVEPVKAPKSVDVGNKIEIPKTDTTEPKLAEPPKVEPVKKAEPAKTEPEKAVPVAKIKAENPKMRHFDPFSGAETESGHGSQSQVPYYDKPYEPGMKPAGYTQDPGDRTKPQPAPDQEEDDVVTKGVKKAAGAVASLFKKKQKQEPDRDMKSPMSEAALNPKIEKALASSPGGVEVQMKHKKTGKVTSTKFFGTHSAVAAAKSHIKDMEAKGYEMHAKKLIEQEDNLAKENTMDKTKLVVEKMMKKLDPVGKEDADVNNDGKTDKTDSYLANRRKAIAAAMKKEEVEQVESNNVEQVDEASYSAKAARAGKDIGKPGKMFGKIAASAAKRYGSEEAGKRVAGAILKKIRAKGK
jgi:hypothetical protein